MRTRRRQAVSYNELSEHDKNAVARFKSFLLRVKAERDAGASFEDANKKAHADEYGEQVYPPRAPRRNTP